MDKRKLLILAAVVSAAVAIVVLKDILIAKRLNEPVRSTFYMACLGSGTPITACMCLEKAAILTSGISHIRVNGGEVEAEKFMEAVRQAVPDCRQQTLKEIAGDIDDAAKSIIDNSPEES